MYEELVKRLKRCEQFRCRECEYENVLGCRAKLNSEAADAIEELSRLHEAQRQNLITLMNEEPETEWIPVKEAYPETSVEVLVTFIVNGDINARYVEAATWYDGYDGDDGFWVSAWDEYRVPGTKIEIVAWMPFPEPYKPTEDEI